jgi:predicted nuclease with RNAse H fold
MPIAGVDFGSKLAGTTVAASPHFAPLIVRSRKGEDADAFLADALLDKGIRTVFLDAPLSLPGVYTGMSGRSDYHYREGDRTLGAMSPMFLGGLTARAMRLRSLFEKNGIAVLETYPAEQARRLGLHHIGYKKKTARPSDLGPHLLPLLGSCEITAAEIMTWHDFDALLALLAGVRWTAGEAVFIGDPAEGGIWI